METHLDDMSLEQIRDLATQQARDEMGRFIKVDDTPVDDVPVVDDTVDDDVDDTPEVFEEIIDLGDGSGTQIFRADSEKALRRKLVDAQTNATRKIREQEARLKAIEDNASTTKLTEDQRYVLSQRIIAEPDVVIREQAEKLLNEREEKARKASQAEAQAVQARIETANAWMATTPDFHDTPENARKVGRYLQTQGLDFTAANLNLAYAEIGEFLTAKPAEKAAVSRHADIPAVQRRSSSSFPSRQAVAPVVKEVDPYDMPLDQLREKIARDYAASLK